MAEQACGVALPHGTVEDAIAHIGAGFDTPWWGTKCSENLVNVGIVIGRQRTPLIGWRLDYDPVKGLHINYEDTSGREKVSIYHQVKPLLVGRTPEDLMVEYWLGWTKRHADDIPTAVLTEFKRTYHACVTNGGGTAAQKTRLGQTKMALFGFGQVPT